MTNLFLAKNTIVIQLPPKPYTTDELEFASEVVLDKPKCDVAVDCSQIGLITCTALCGFMKLQMDQSQFIWRILELKETQEMQIIYLVFLCQSLVLKMI